MVATTIMSEASIFLADRKQYTFHVFDRVVLVGEELHDGSRSGALVEERVLSAASFREHDRDGGARQAARITRACPAPAATAGPAAP
jgi:hypothetical protein